MARSTIEFGATRIASSEWLMDIAYDVMNKHNFAGLAEHEEMLSDRVRIDTYHRGIIRNIHPGDVVLDLGTGTGVLAMMASRAGARKVYAVEHSEFIEVAREIAAHNGFTNIEFVQANSREFTPPEPIDVVLHEQMGDELFNENLLGNVLDLRNRVLRAGGRILPGRFRLFIEPVSLRESMRVRRLWNIDLPDGIDLSCLRSSPVAARYDHGRMEHLWARAGSVGAHSARPHRSWRSISPRWRARLRFPPSSWSSAPPCSTRSSMVPVCGSRPCSTTRRCSPPRRSHRSRVGAIACSASTARWAKASSCACGCG